MQKKLNGFDFDVFLIGDPYTGALSQPTEFNTADALGLVPGYSGVFAFGFNPSINTGSAPEDAWGGDGLYPWIPSSKQLEIVSTSASDTGAGVGARTVAVTALDSNYAPLVQIVTLNGLTPVQIPLPVLRTNGGRCLTAGASDTNVGDIIIRDTAAALRVE